MTKKYSFNSNSCWPKDNLILDKLDEIFYHQEEPFGSTSIIAQWEVMQLAKERQVTVLLDGQGADETLAGYYKYFEPFLAELYVKDKKRFRHELDAMHKNLGLEDLLSNRFKLESKYPKAVKTIGNFTRKLSSLEK